LIITPSTPPVIVPGAGTIPPLAIQHGTAVLQKDAVMRAAGDLAVIRDKAGRTRDPDPVDAGDDPALGVRDVAAAVDLDAGDRGAAVVGDEGAPGLRDGRRVRDGAEAGPAAAAPTPLPPNDSASCTTAVPLSSVSTPPE
jgi:hypothetical protein